MGYTFRTSGPWGPGISEDLTPAQVDSNFWQAIQDIQEKAAQGVGISNFVVSGNQMTVVLTDHTLLGPYPLPIAVLRFQGEWIPNTYYAANDIITHAGSTYIVQVNHTSAATFDPYANDGLGTDLYGLLLENPASTIPAGGPAGRFLRKATSADYVTEWAEAALDDLSDVLVSAPATGQVLGYDSGGWQNVDVPLPPLDGLSDVTISTVADGDVLTYDQTAAAWENKKVNLPLSGLTDVAVATPQAGQPLVFNGIEWIDASTVDMPCGGLISVSGNVNIDRSTGEVKRLMLTGTATLVGISGWPPGGQFARLVVEIQNSGGFGFAWPSNVKWPSGVVPAVTAATGGVTGKDVYILITFDGGSTIYGNLVGQAFA